MAIKPLNSVAGFSIGEYPTVVVVDANGNVSANALSVTGTSNLGAVGNITITGGSSGQFLQTNGSGVLTWATVSTTSLSNGTSNILIVNNGNIAFSSAGNANVVIITGTGANIDGTLNVTGNANVGNIGANNGVFTSVAGTLTTASQTNITSVGTLTSLNVSGNIVAPNIIANTGVFYGNGSGLTNLTGANVTGTVANATYATSAGSATTAATVTTNAQPNITSVGTLTSLDVSGNIVGPNIIANTGVFYGNGSGLTNITGANVTGTVANATYATSAGSATTATSATTAGTVTTNAQPNITSVGTLTSLDVSGNFTAPNIIANTGVFYGNGSGLTNIAGANVTGTVANATYAVSAGSATTAGTVTTNAQPNITSVGTLSSLTVSGNISGNNFASTNYITAGNGLTVTSGGMTVTGNIDVTGNINVTGNLNYSNVTDLVVGDPLIYIGANNTGNLYDLGIVASYNDGTYYHTGIARNHNNGYWTFFDGVVNEPTTVIDWANATYPTVKLGNLLATGTANIIGNANVGNLGASQVLASANITAPQLISNVTTGTAPFVVTSTTRVSNLNVAYSNVSDYGVITSQTTGTYYPTFVSSSSSGNYALSSNNAFSANLANGGFAATTFIGNLSGTNANITTANVSGNIILGNSSVTTTIKWGSVTTTSISANQTIASVLVSGITGVEFLVKGIDSTGSKYTVATVSAVTDGASADYSTYGTVTLGGYTGTFAVNIVADTLCLQVTPASTNSTIWTTQYRLI